MSFEDFDFNDWDANFLEQAIQAEEEIITKSSKNPTQKPQSSSSILNHHSFSPPRELSQSFWFSDNNNVSDLVTPKPLNGNVGKEEDSEIDRLKKELGRVSEQLNHLQQECLELKKDRDEKEEQLKSAFNHIDAKNNEIHCSKRLPRNSVNVLEGRENPSSGRQPRESHPPVRRNIQSDGISVANDHRHRILIDNASTSSNEHSGQKIVLPETSAQPKLSKAVGVQTDAFADFSLFTTENELHFQPDLLNELLGIWGSPNNQKSGRSMVSKLFMTCAADFYALFRCMGMTMPSNITPDSLAGGSFSDVFSETQHVQSSEAAKVARLYFILTKTNNGMVQLDVLIDALLDLCALENVVVVHRSLRILHAILQYLLSLHTRFDQRDNVMVEGVSPKNDNIDFFKFEEVQTGVKFGAIRNKSPFPSEVSSSMRSFNLDTIQNKKHGCDGHVAIVSALDWASLFEKIHHITMGNKDECIQVEAIIIMNLILMRSNPFLEREKFGSIALFQTVSRLLQRDAGLPVQKQALRLLFLLLNCPKLFVLFCSGCNDGMGAGSAAGNVRDVSTCQVFTNILEGLAECVRCRGHGAVGLKLRRLAIIVLAFMASSGKSGFEVILNPRISDRVNFLELIMQTLASEMDAEETEQAELPEICIERTAFLREALILLNRLASSPASSGAVLRSLASSRDTASLTIDVVNRMSKKRRGWWKSDSNKKRKTEDEIVDLVRGFKARVFAYLGDHIS